ncbi:unnamed protein product [marine sediment metagenome]|uniref:Uncharacterized protein n=1 Tax=marine sediment metagenome TaxID=412755 RepID=X1RZX5_9ZZZZ
MARKRTKAEALERLHGISDEVGGIPLKGKAKAIRDGALLGAAGLIMLDPLNLLADSKIVLPLDMVAIPAYQAYMIEGSPSMQIYIRAGETIVPTGGNVRDVQEAVDEAATDFQVEVENKVSPTPSAYQRRYKKAFARLKPEYVKKDGTWKKNGFKRCVKAAHAVARKN